MVVLLLPGERRGRAVVGKIFLNYRRSDADAWADRLYERLRAQLPASDVFMDIDGNIPLGVPWVEWIESHVAACDLMLVLIGRSWVAEFEARSAAGERDFVRVEIERALSRKIPVVPVFLGDAPVPSAASLPASIRSLLELQATRVQRVSYDADIKVLIEGMVRSIELARAEAVEPARPVRPEDQQRQNWDREERLMREQKELEDEERIWADAKWSKSPDLVHAYLKRYQTKARFAAEAHRLLGEWNEEERQRQRREEEERRQRELADMRQREEQRHAQALDEGRRQQARAAQQRKALEQEIQHATAVPEPLQQPASIEAGRLLHWVLLLALGFGVYWLVSIRPQEQRQAQEREQLEEGRQAALREEQRAEAEAQEQRERQQRWQEQKCNEASQLRGVLFPGFEVIPSARKTFDGVSFIDTTGAPEVRGMSALAMAEACAAWCRMNSTCGGFDISGTREDCDFFGANVAVTSEASDCTEYWFKKVGGAPGEISPVNPPAN
jgi:hypothetical protein